jgi:hypothetical protein
LTVAGSWELVGVGVGLVVIVGIITVWWRKEMTSRDEGGKRRTRRLR